MTKLFLSFLTLLLCTNYSMAQVKSPSMDEAVKKQELSHRAQLVADATQLSDGISVEEYAYAENLKNTDTEKYQEYLRNKLSIKLLEDSLLNDKGMDEESRNRKKAKLAALKSKHHLN